MLYATAAQSTSEYENAAAKKGKTPYVIAVADFLNAPSIEKVDISAYHGQPGDTIRIRVTDDMSVKAVAVRINNADGTLVEESLAQPDVSGYEWTFTAAQANNNLEGDKITVFASDIPGNIAFNEQTL